MPFLASAAPAAAMLLALALAGCIGPGGPGPAAAPVAAAPPATITTGGVTADAFAGVRFHGGPLEAPSPGPADLAGRVLGAAAPSEAACGPPQCERVAFRLDLDPADRRAAAALLEVAAVWPPEDEDYDTVQTRHVLAWRPGHPPPQRADVDGEYWGWSQAYLTLRVARADGAGPGDGATHWWWKHAEGWHAPNPGPGDYVVEAEALVTKRPLPFELLVRLRDPAPANPAGEALPDLRMLPPRHLAIDAPIGREAAAALGPLGGCGPDEAAQARVLRCLRFSSDVANLGPGDFEMRLTPEQARSGVALRDAHWVQRIHAGDGSHRDVPAAGARFHAVHGHFHSEGIAKASVHAWDPSTGERGPAVGEGRKTGFCFGEAGIHGLGGPWQPPQLRENGCCYFADTCGQDAARGDIVMGIAPGWYDVYPWWRADQYVDLDGVPDGVYELVAVINPGGVVLEADHGNNEASVLFRLTGDEVEELGPPPGRRGG